MKRSIFNPDRLNKSQIKEIVQEGSGIAVCFTGGHVLHAREGKILQNCKVIRIDARGKNFRLFAKTKVKGASLRDNSLEIRLKGKDALFISSGFLVANGRTFDIEGEQKLKERGIYLRDGV